jgi:putative ABC transport system permease protein
MSAGASDLTRQQLLWRTASFYRLPCLLVTLGVAAATAVIVGALVVGDSVRGSLRSMAIDRLGRIEAALLSPRFVSPELADRLRSLADYPADWAPPLPAILFPNGSAETGPADQLRVAGSILVLATGPEFWDLGQVRPARLPQPGQVVLNQPLADQLGVQVGDRVTLRLPAELAVPADSPLGRRDNRTEGLPDLEVVDIVPAQSLGRFALRSSQRTPRNAYLPLESVQQALQRPDKINCLLLANRLQPSDTAAELRRSVELAAQLTERLQPTLDDLGLELQRVRRLFPDAQLGEPASPPGQPTPEPTASQSEPPAEQTAAAAEPTSPPADEPTIAFDYFHLTSEQLLLPDRVVEAVQNELGREHTLAVLTYLANLIEVIDQERPLVTYSTITAVDPGVTLPLRWDGPGGGDGRIPPDSVVVNQWLTDRQQLQIGDRLRLSYYLPETIYGEEVEQTLDVAVAGIVPLTEPTRRYSRRQVARFDSPPTLINDPRLTPEVPGVTDQDSIRDWDLPFVLQYEVPTADDDYWQSHRLTPKLFLPLQLGQQHFGSRFGHVSSVRIDPTLEDDPERLTQRVLAALQPLAGELGLRLLPLRAEQLSAARGTTPFDMLFLSLSFFVIVSALMLVGLLFRLSLEQRAAQWGLLQAIGWPLKSVRRLVTTEGLYQSLLGGAIGAGLGLLYARMMIEGLRTWWVGAVSVPFLDFHYTLRSLLIGAAAGLLCGWWSIRLSSRLLARLPARVLLAGRCQPEESVVADASRAGRGVAGAGRLMAWISLGLVAAAVAVSLLGWWLSGQAQAGAFVGSGMLLLMAGILAVYRQLSRPNPSSAETAGNAQSVTMTDSLLQLAASAAARQPLRSTLAIGLMAVASFLILAMSLFQAEADPQGVGGFDLVVEGSRPIYRPLGLAAEQQEALGSEAETLAASDIISCRLRPGDDASCTNLYQASQPRVLGVPQQLDRLQARADWGVGFRWAGWQADSVDDRRQDAATLPEPVVTPWHLLGPGRPVAEPMIRCRW